MSCRSTLCSCTTREPADWHEFQAQRQIAAALPHSYLAVTIDLSREWFTDNHPIHPATKQPIGQRPAGAALANLYGQDIVIPVR